MKILLLGSEGQVGWELQRALLPLGNVQGVDKEDVDFEDLDALRSFVRTTKPDVIVNAAAYTAVDKAEENQDLAYKINAEAVSVLAEEALSSQAWLIHYSTDYVYDGSKQEAYVETDPTGPLGVYGQTKLAGEEMIRESGCKHLIFRTSWVYGIHGLNFPKTMLRLAKSHDELRIVNDQYGAPASAELIADLTAFCIARLVSDEKLSSQAVGTYHLTPEGKTSWRDFAFFLLSEATQQGVELHTDLKKIHGIPTKDYPLPARRPTNSLLNSSKLENTFGITLPPWQLHAKRFIEKIAQGAQL